MMFTTKYLILFGKSIHNNEPLMQVTIYQNLKY